MARTNEKVSKETKKTTKKSSKSSVEKKTAQKKAAAPVPQVLKLVKNDPYLVGYEAAINGRHAEAARKISASTRQKTDGCCASGLPMLSTSLS